MVFHWRLSDNKSPQVSRTLLSILAVFNNVVVWMVSTRSPTSKSSRLFNNPLVTVPKAPIPIGIVVTFMFHSFFNSLARSRYLFLFSHSFSFILWSAGTAKSIVLQVLFFCWYNNQQKKKRDLVFGPRLGDSFVYQSPTGVCVLLLLLLLFVRKALGLLPNKLAKFSLPFSFPVQIIVSNHSSKNLPWRLGL